MLERNFTIKQIAPKNCFCYMSPKVFKHLIHKTYVKIVCQDERVIFLSLGAPMEAVAESELGLSGLYLKALGLKENDIVTLSEIPQLPEITSVKVSPLTENDYDILDLVANEVQANLLSQLKVVANGQNFVAWVGNSISIMLHTDYIFPISPGILDDMTELVIVKPNTFDASHAKHISNASVEDKLSDSRSKIDGHDKCEVKNFQPDILEKYIYQKSDLIVRLVPMSSFAKLQELFSDHMFMFSVFVFRGNIPSEWTLQDTSRNVIVCALKKLKEDIFDDAVVYVRFCIIEDFIKDIEMFDIFVEDNIFVHKTLLKSLKGHIGERLFLKPVNYVNLPTVKEIHIRFSKVSEDDMKEMFMKKLADICEKHNIILNGASSIEFLSGMACSLEFVPSEAKMCVVNPEFLRDCKFCVSDGLFNWHKEDTTSKPEVNFIMSISNFEDTVAECLVRYSAKMKYRNHRQNILITGKLGSGKSALLEIIKRKFPNQPYFAYIETIHCKTLKGKTLESLQKVFSVAFTNLINYQPAVLVIDDLHIVCKYVDNGKDTATIYFNKVSEMLHNMFYSYTSNNLITIIATIPTVFSLNKNIYESRGSHLFQRILEIGDLNKEDKGKSLEFLLSQYDFSDINFEQLSLKMEGFVMQDIVDLSKKALFFALKEAQEKQHAEEKLVITHSHCIEALKNTVVLSLDNINLHSSGERDFTDIGGLNNVKKILIESLFWPAKYSKIFDNAPLRLQSGLLLYGPPGTGKTILAGAAAKQCGLRLISVKGPELLSKYIGASEQAVRDIFEKAQCAKPCILFFDEFDSLAPRRGHDNTGVTDRVVNQLLTQLDGVESLSGVCVLAATSRPDLLDPALLRPGRLDRQVKCPLPDKNARLEILQALSKSMKLALDVNLDSIASRTEGFSGADLQSVLYSGQLSSVAHLFGDNKDAMMTDSSEVTQSHLENALRKTRPSLSKRELAKYERKYRMFEGGNLPNVQVGTKATLA